MKLSYKEQEGNKRFPDTAMIEVSITAYYDIPRSVSKKCKALMLEGKLRPTKKPDFDNVCKTICDALNGIAYHDDASIVVMWELKAE